MIATIALLLNLSCNGALTRLTSCHPSGIAGISDVGWRRRERGIYERADAGGMSLGKSLKMRPGGAFDKASGHLRFNYHADYPRSCFAATGR